MQYKKIKQLYSRLNFVTFIKVASVEAFQRLFFREMKYFFSQEGEDVKILSLLQKHSDGFYLDVGSNDPISNSNTFKLYLLGWRGILVDGNMQLINKAKRIRKMDTCVHALVSNKVERVKFYIAADHLMSTVDKQFAGLVASHNYSLQEVEMETVTLDTIIDNHVPKGVHIDVLSIDVEAHDFEVLQSLNLNKHEPTLIVIEDLNHWKIPLSENVFNNYLVKHNYSLVGKDSLNLYFMKRLDT